jgi:superfamily II DNA or RNA helicase
MSRAIITEAGVCFKAKRDKILERAKKRYEIHFQLFNGIKRQLILWSYSKGIYRFPRFAYIWLKKAKLISGAKSVLSQGEDIKLQSTLVPTKNQQLVVDHLMANRFTPERIAQGIGGGTIEMGTGRGKTFLAMTMLLKFQKKTLVVVPNQLLLGQWLEDMRGQFPDTNFGEISSKRHVDGDIVVASMQSIKPKLFGRRKKDGGVRKTLEYIRRFGFIVLDEIHLYNTEKFKTIFSVAQCARTLGLTATSNDRNDPFDPCAWYWYGYPIKAEELPGFDVTGTDFKTLIKTVRYYGPPEYTRTVKNRDGVPSSGGTINLIMKDPERKTALLNLVREQHAENRNVYLILEHRKAVDEYAEALSDLNVDRPEVNKLMGGVSAETVSDTREHARIIVCTYQYITVGVSIVRMDTIILGSPRKSNFKQLIGRIRRLGSDEGIDRIVIDIVDARSFLARQYYVRKKIYTEFFEAAFEEQKIYSICD